MPAATACPRWDLTPFFSSIDSPEFVASFKVLGESLASFEKFVDDNRIGNGAGSEPFEETLAAYMRIIDELRQHGVYIDALISTNSLDVVAQARESELDGLRSRFQAVDNKITSWLGTLDVDALVASSEIARTHEHFLRRAQTLAKKMMSPAEEALAAKLGPSGGTAWAKLHNTVTSQILVTVDLPVGKETLPMSAVRNLAYDSDRSVRARAYEAELAGWKANEVPCAAAMNSIKGEVGTLAELRGWSSPLERSLFDAAIDQATLDAMLSAANESFPDFRRYMRAKAKLLGVPKLAWFDLFAPVGGSDQSWAYDDATVFVEKHFRGYSDKMGDFAARAYAERWIDAEPRPGKSDGAYCSGFGGDVSRVFMNFKPAFGSVSTLAHELGHAYHNLCLANRTRIQRRTPMTLAETASIFCETILKRAALEQATESQSLSILEASLQGCNQVVVDISSRFLFEKATFSGRKGREFSPQELCGLMLDAQKATYGDGLDEEQLHPYMWAVKGHYYSTGLSFYNFPYMFGLLFALGLYAIYDESPDGFRDRYDNLLSRTGMADAATLAAEFGIDIRTPEFWRASLGIIKRDIDRFVALVG